MCVYVLNPCTFDFNEFTKMPAGKKFYYRMLYVSHISYRDIYIYILLKAVHCGGCVPTCKNA